MLEGGLGKLAAHRFANYAVQVRQGMCVNSGLTLRVCY